MSKYEIMKRTAIKYVLPIILIGSFISCPNHFNKHEYQINRSKIRIHEGVIMDEITEIQADGDKIIYRLNLPHYGLARLKVNGKKISETKEKEVYKVGENRLEMILNKIRSIDESRRNSEKKKLIEMIKSD